MAKLPQYDLGCLTKIRAPPQPEFHQKWLIYMEIVPQFWRWHPKYINHVTCPESEQVYVSIGLLRFQCQRSYLRIEAFMQTELTWCMIEQLSGAIDRRRWICMNISEIFMIHVYIYRNTYACMYMNVYGCICKYVYMCTVCLCMCCMSGACICIHVRIGICA